MSKTNYTTYNKIEERGFDSLTTVNYPIENYDKDLKLLTSICDVQTKSGDCASITEFIEDILSQPEFDTVDYVIDAAGNILITKGVSKLYPCFAAHLDTVHTIKKDREVVYNSKNHRLHAIADTGLVGIGGDDRAGIFIAIKALLTFEYCKVALFVDEEVGMVGSSKVDLNFFDDCGFIIEPDRKGNKDLIYHTNGRTVASEEFIEKFMEILEETPYDYSRVMGTATDVGELRRRGLKIASCNISCGYYNAHTSDEHINVVDLLVCWQGILAFTNKYKTHKFVFEIPEIKPVHTVEKKTVFDYNDKEIIPFLDYGVPKNQLKSLSKGFIHGFNKGYKEALKTLAKKPLSLLEDSLDMKVDLSDYTRETTFDCPNGCIGYSIKRTINNYEDYREMYACTCCKEKFSYMEVYDATNSAI